MSPHTPSLLTAISMWQGEHVHCAIRVLLRGTSKHHEERTDPPLLSFPVLASGADESYECSPVAGVWLGELGHGMS
jgi:hypothetical protein